MNSHVAANEGGTGTDCAEAEEEDEDASSLSYSSSPEDPLDRFRREWKQELSAKRPLSESPDLLGEVDAVVTDRDAARNNNKAEDDFEVARRSFLHGVDAERKGMMFDAIQFYRKAIQLEPDIEAMIFRGNNRMQQDRSRLNSPAPSRPDSAMDSSSKEFLDQMIGRVDTSNQVVKASPVRSRLHITKLPPEVIDYILRWVTSSEMDLRSLEIVSLVSPEFYVAVRRSKIWEEACVWTWGVRLGPLEDFVSWRDMFIRRPHLWYNGVYISRMSYIRHGEASFQDHFYRPWHMVTYYRYVRFFADGTMLMLTTPDEPLVAIPQLKQKLPKHPAVMKGSYRLIGQNNVTGILLKNRKNLDRLGYLYAPKRNSRERQTYLNKQDLVFMIDLQIGAYRGKINNQLKWLNYEIISRTIQAGESRTSCDLNDQSFPPFVFSRVKSYMTPSFAPFVL